MSKALSLRLEAASGSSEAHDAVEAGRAAATEAMAGLNGATPAMIIVYASVRYDLPTLIGAIRAVTGDTPLVGETSAGHFRGADLTHPHSGVAVLAMTAGPYRFAVASVERLSRGRRRPGLSWPGRPARPSATPAPVRHNDGLRRRAGRRAAGARRRPAPRDRLRGAGGRRRGGATTAS